MNPLLAHLVEAASRAPSAHNAQPWLLQWRENELRVRVAEDRMLPVADPEGSDTLHALGALLENLLLTLGQLGFEGAYVIPQQWDRSEPVIVLRWHHCVGPRPDSRLYRMIPIRRTSRLKYLDEPIPVAALDGIRLAAACPAKLYVLTAKPAMREIGSLAAAAGAEALRKKQYARELYRWMRFSRRDPGWYRDGLNAECMGLNRIKAAVAQQLLKPEVAAYLTKFSWSKLLYANADDHAPFAPAMCLLTTQDPSTAGRVEAGHTLQRVWLTAASHGLVTHPLSAAVDEPKSRRRVFEIFDVPPGEVHVNLFRLGKSPKTAPSARLPADELLEPYA
jgi:nitroreductase